jgi:ribonuclease HI
VKGRATNNCGEIQASILAIKRAHQYGIKQLEVMTDSQFLIKSICVWLPNWKRRNWKLPDGKPVKNKTDFEELDRVMTETDMTIRWVS